LNSHVALRERIERQHRAAQEVPHLVRQKTKMLYPGATDGPVTLMLVLGHGLGDGVVETAIKRLKVVSANRDVAFIRQLGHALADTPIVVDHLADGESEAQQFRAV
jgi:hypothetical protein